MINITWRKLIFLVIFITDEKVIRNSLIVDEGDAYNDILINKSINEIQARHIFKNVTKNIKEGSNPKYKVIDIYCRGKTHR